MKYAIVPSSQASHQRPPQLFSRDRVSSDPAAVVQAKPKIPFPHPWLWVFLLILVSWIMAFAPSTHSQSRGQQIALKCRITGGAWLPCRMEVEELGVRWVLVVGEQRIEFRHDGQGAVTMQRNGRWRAVTSQWGEDRSLCWDGVCAMGDLPLD